jgi:hypothetical protein
MNKNTLLVLAAVTVAGVGVAMFSNRDGSGPTATAGVRRPLFPGLEERVNDVARITLEKGANTVTIERSGEDWTLPERGGYPAKFAEAKKVAVRLAGLQIEEEKTAREENHARLLVEWPPAASEDADADGEPGLVKLFDAGGQELAALVVGKSEWLGGAQKLFVRPTSGNQVYLVEGPLDVLAEVRSWIDPKVLDIPRDRVQTVAISHPDGELIDIGRSATNHTDFKVQNVPPGETERYEGIANGIGGALAGLTIEDVRPVAEVDFAAEPVARTVFTTIDGLVLTIETARFEEKTWIKIACAHDAPEPVAAPEEGDEEAAPDEGTKPDPEAIAAEATDLEARLSPWAFAVPQYKADSLARHMKDLLAVPQPEGTEPPLDPDGFGFPTPTGDEANDLMDAFRAQHPDLADPAEGSGEREVKEAPPTDDEEPAEGQEPPADPRDE